MFEDQIMTTTSEVLHSGNLAQLNGELDNQIDLRVTRFLRTEEIRQIQET